MIKHISFSLVAACLALVSCSPKAAETSPDAQMVPQTLTIYSSRHYDSDRALYAAYEEKTGVKVQIREAGADQLLETMKAEGTNSPADLIIAADAGALWRFQDAGLTQPLDDAEIDAHVPANLRQSEGHWIGLGKRVRLVAYDPERFTEPDVDAWLKLAEPDKQGEICVRSSSNIYNLSLMAEMIARLGSEGAEAWARGIVANMARNPQGGDTDQVRAVAAGQCGIAIVNHYYWLRLATSASVSDRNIAEATKITIPHFPDGKGAHVNITGIAVSASAKDAELAKDFILFLMSDEGQQMLTTETKELPISATATLPEGADMIPAYTPSDTPLDKYGENQAEAQRLYDLAGWK